MNGGKRAYKLQYPKSVNSMGLLDHTSPPYNNQNQLGAVCVLHMPYGEWATHMGTELTNESKSVYV